MDINKLLVLIKKLTNAVVEQTRTKPQEILKYKLSKQMETFSCNPPISLTEEENGY